ncbi:multiple sugar transport system permease protein/fructooligosaccharide transport system permease protein [Salipaludibacillus aurantiacus]|uniref:Multiple sugar transport system permease protein/fructooligosaccharide transport system permease protein n=2 Tax=Salipaludibacillus aurantiacus TaxID=1601833 RepID=A0A1H9TF12_9BACI|nr:multiple sugar transport system permease protein/fructooligosaccharide transport system permease protein [Salipaludibacillus aurantiacus]
MKAMKKPVLTKKILLYVTMSFLAVIFLFPLVWMVMSSLKGDVQIFRDMTSIKAFLPPMPNEVDGSYFQNYIMAFERVNLFRYIMNSLIYTIGIIIFGLIVNSMAGYALARFQFPLRNFWLAVIIATLIIPPESIFLPLYVLVFNLGWVNTYTGLIVPFIANAFAIFLFRQFFLDFPRELEEAAKIDGCSQIGIFFRIIVPLSKPVFATVAIVLFINHWNDFLWPLVVANDDSMRTIQIGLQYFMNQPPIQWGQVMAALTVATVPMLLIFIFLQRYYVQGLAHTGSKN